MAEGHRVCLAGLTWWAGNTLGLDMLGFGAKLEPMAQTCPVPLTVPPRPQQGGGYMPGGSLPPSATLIPGNLLVTQGRISAHSSGQSPRILQKKKKKKKEKNIIQ